MTTYVLVHGAWHGGWCWQRVAAGLRAAGHEVLTPTLTGLGERSHLLTRSVGLATHIEDVLATLRYEQVSDAVLVGHSYAGMVITGVAARVPERLRLVVYVDGLTPQDGDNGLSLLPEGARQHYQSSAAERGDGWLIPPRPLPALGVTDQAAVDWLAPRLGPQPLATYTERISLPDRIDVPRHYLACVGWAAVLSGQAERARRWGWPVTELDADHEVMATAPDLLVKHLLQLPGR